MNYEFSREHDAMVTCTNALKDPRLGDRCLLQHMTISLGIICDKLDELNEKIKKVEEELNEI